MATLQEIHARLDQGYFLKEDMETLGLKGYVSVAQMRAEVASLLIPEAPPPVADVFAEANARRAVEAQAAAAKEAQETADRAALIASIEAKQQGAQQEVLETNEAQGVVRRFLDAVKNDPNVQTTP